MATKSSGINITIADSAASIGQSGSSGGTYTVQIVNRSADSAATVQLGISATDNAFENARKILQGEVIPAGDQITYSPVVCEGDDYIIGQSTITSVNFLMMGFDE